MGKKKHYSGKKSNKSPKEPIRSNPELRSRAKCYSDEGYDSVDAVRYAIEDLLPTSPDEILRYPGVGTWRMGKERLSHRISENLRARRSTPGRMAGS